MRLKTKLVLAAAGVTFALVSVLSAIFLAALLNQRISQTAANNDVLAREVLMMTRQAIETGLRTHPPVDQTSEALQAAVADALRSHDPLLDVMSAIVRYSPAVQDVSVTDAHGRTLVSTDPQTWNQLVPARTNFNRVLEGSVAYQVREMFGRARVLDVSAPLDRNGVPFLVVHMGVRSTFLKNNYAPFLRDAGLFALLAGVISMAAAALLASLALRPIEQISRQLEKLTPDAEEFGGGAAGQRARHLGLSTGLRGDAVVRVTNTIDRLGRQIRTTEEGYTALRANLDQVLDTLRDGVMLFTAERRAVMASDAVAHFLPAWTKDPATPLVGRRLEEIFTPSTALGQAVLAAFESGSAVAAQTVILEDGQQVEISLDLILDPALHEKGNTRQMGTLLTLRDTYTAMQIEQEMEVSRRLAAIGRLTAGVGHEVKNPINAMVVHLELLKSKLAGGADIAGAQRHAEVLAGEMQRLDRVVQTLADFSRPMELHLRDQDLRGIIDSVVQLTGHEMEENKVEVKNEAPRDPLTVRVDEELIRQALLNLMLNAMQAMPDGGLLQVSARRDHQFAVVEITDQGQGIAPELMPRIFELYFTTKAKGSGIGLAMTYRILQMHGGAMDVRSTVDSRLDVEGRSNPEARSEERGTTFTLRLPLSAASSKSAEPRLVGHLAAGGGS